MRKTLQPRVCVYAKDVQLITGRKESAARQLLKKIRQQYNIADHQFITVEDFCRYTGLKPEQVTPFLTS